MATTPLDNRNLLDPKDSREVRTDFASGGARCTARSKRTGKPCQRPAILGGNVCYHHGGSAPQTKAKALRRLEQATDVLVQRLLGFALDGRVADPVALQAIRDALDRAGMNPKTAVEVSIAPWQDVLEGIADVAHISRAESRARPGITEPEPELPEPAALPAADDDAIVDAELVDPPDWVTTEPPLRPTRPGLQTLDAAIAPDRRV